MEGDPLDRHKALQAAERLLKQGKVQEALAQLERLAAGAPGDPITLNRMGDLLAKQGRTAEAIGYYGRIADQFTRQGFYPKAVAIYKKILRLEPNDAGALSSLGDVYLQQKLPGEARAYLLRAAELHVADGGHREARSIYERLVQAEPDNPMHRARLAETRAAEGDSGSAAEELCRLGDRLVERGEFGEARASYRRALDLVPGHAGATLGTARCLSDGGEEAEAIPLLTAALETTGAPEVLGELILRHDERGESERVDALLGHAAAVRLPIDSVKALFDRYRDGDGALALWERIDAPLATWTAADPGRVAELLDALASLEPSGHLPALERRVRHAEASGSKEATADALRALIRSLRARGRDSSEQERRLEALVPSETPSRKEPAAAEGSGAPGGVQEPSRPAASGADRAEASLDADAAEAPAVPLNRSDEEFVAGRVTQAEILEKYGLVEKAMEQLREVVAKFPGHLDAQERRLSLLRNADADAAELREALVGVALARRADGKHDTARRAAEEAAGLGELGAERTAILRRLGLLRDPSEAKTSAAPAAPAATPAGTKPAGDDEFVIDFAVDDDDQEDEGVDDDAGDGAGDGGAASATAEEDDDLSAITAALEDELFAGSEEHEPPKAESEQSLEEVFAAFREQVDKEVDSDDFRTHYDLGIGYMEMGLLDEAVREFEIAEGSPDLRRDACVMLAVCHRNRQDPASSIDWFRKALACDSDDAAKVHELRYDLAEVLLDRGDVEAALVEFRAVCGDDPGFRDVAVRVRELESRQPS